MIRIRFLSAALLLLLGGCASLPPSIPIFGSRTDLRAMAGEWRGEYESPATGRSGSILFRLSANADSAFGDVVMVPRIQQRELPEARTGSAPMVAAAPLTIRFVRVSGGRVGGALEPYRDPDCECLVSTTFEGTVRGDHASGTLRTRGPSGTVEGTWRADRAR